MQNKLLEILNNIELEDQYIKMFEDSYIDRIILDKENKKYKINICSYVKIENEIIEHVRTLFLKKYKNINDILFEIVNLNIEKKEKIKEDKQKIVNDKKADNHIYGYESNNDYGITRIDNISSEENNVTIEAKLFGVDLFESSKSDFKIITMKLTDYTSSIYAKVFFRDKNEFDDLAKKLVKDNWYRVTGYIKNDVYAKCLVLTAQNISIIDSKDIVRYDDDEVKRVELHTHTLMSQMDSVANVTKLIKKAKEFGHKAIAITDHNSVQAFPEAYNNRDGLKLIYGVELNVINDNIDVVTNETDDELLSKTYVVFDTETTGFNAGGKDQMIEIGAVKICNGEIIETFDELINPNRPIPSKITELTNITDEMVKNCENEEVVMKKFVGFFGDLPLVAHNAKFDMSFLNAAVKKYNLEPINNTVIDTLELSRMMDSSYNKHTLSALVKRYNVDFDEEGHHRADYDADATAKVFFKMIKKLTDMNIKKISDIKGIIEEDDIYKFGKVYHMTCLVKNKDGLRNLFKLVSLANTKYLQKTPRILRSEINKYRDGLLIGSACSSGEIFIQARSKSDEELSNLMEFYDYIEIQPVELYDYLVQTGDFLNTDEVIDNIRKIIRVAKQKGKTIVATGDVHQIDPKDKIYREVIINQKLPSGGFHHLYKPGKITNIPSFHFMTTKEMLDSFYFLNYEDRYEIVVTNTNKICDMIDDELQIIKDKLYTPKMNNSSKEVEEMVYSEARKLYGEELPELIEERIKKELEGIIGGGYDVIYLIAEKLVKKSNSDGYIVGSRGSVGSSFVATMMGITEVNPLPPHYLCPNCKKSIFKLDDGTDLGSIYFSGYDLPDKKCDCGYMFKKEGHDMPFATFLGFNADKVPDIDLNFSGEYQWRAHDFTKEMFGDKYVYRAGTISTVAERTAYGFAKGYSEYVNVTLPPAELERLAMGCTGVKRTTGQHPGGIIVVPNYMDIFDFCPYQYPADDNKSRWYTTHFDFHAIHDNVLKLDILGHDDPTALKMLGDLTGVELKDIPFDDKKVLSLFRSPEALGIKAQDIGCETGTLGVPEFGTKFVIEMLKDTKPKTFAELVKISGLSHGTDVWLGNAKDLILNNICEFKDVIGCRDDIMVYLMYNGLKPIDSFKIMEFVRKGQASKKKEQWEEYVKIMREANISDWFIDTCSKIKYMFPKAHATAYVMMGYRVAWFKVYYPIEYYATYFSVRSSDYDIETMIKGADAIRDKIFEINNKGYEATNKEASTSSELEIALEMCVRGFKFGNIDLYKSDATKFIIDEDRKTLIPPFRTIDGLGDTVAKNIVKERNIKSFLSIEDLQVRAKVSQTLIEKMKYMNILDNMEESNQLSLF